MIFSTYPSSDGHFHLCGLPSVYERVLVQFVLFVFTPRRRCLGPFMLAMGMWLTPCLSSSLGRLFLSWVVLVLPLAVAANSFCCSFSLTAASLWVVLSVSEDFYEGRKFRVKDFSEGEEKGKERDFRRKIKRKWRGGDEGRRSRKQKENNHWRTI